MHSEDLFLYSSSQSWRVSLPPLGTTCMPNLMQEQAFLRVSRVLSIPQNSTRMRQVTPSLKRTTFLLPSSHTPTEIPASPPVWRKISGWMVKVSESPKCGKRSSGQRQRALGYKTFTPKRSVISLSRSSLCSSWKQEELPFLLVGPLIVLTVKLLFVLSFLHLLKKRIT